MSPGAVQVKSDILVPYDITCFARASHIYSARSITVRYESFLNVPYVLIAHMHKLRFPNSFYSI